MLRGIFFGISIAPLIVLLFGNLAASVFSSSFCPSSKHLENRAVNIRLITVKDDTVCGMSCREIIISLASHCPKKNRSQWACGDSDT